MSEYNIIAESPNSTVIAEYIPSIKNATHYQSENELELEFIRLLKNNGYEYLNITQNDDLVKNLRTHLSKLNDIEFSESEWKQIFNNYLANKNENYAEKTTKIQEDSIYSMRRDDGTTKNIHIIDKKNIHNNSLQIINQYEAEGVRKNRYDVTILVNGLPSTYRT